MGMAQVDNTFSKSLVYISIIADHYEFIDNE